MADLSSFSNSSFTVSAWINSALKEKTDDEALESYLAQLAMKLHIVSQEYTEQLETGMVEAMSTMPRVLSEVSKIEEHIKSIENEMATLNAQLKAFDKRNIGGVEDLSRLDTIKINMDRCKSTLQEHARWNQLVREAKAFLDNCISLPDIADRIEVLSHSLAVLQNMPGHNEREEVYLSLVKAVLSTVRPRMNAEVSNQNINHLREYIYVYTKLSRQHEFEGEYVKTRPMLLKTDIERLETSSDLLKGISTFTATVLQVISDEANNTEELFGAENATNVLCLILEEILKPFNKIIERKLAMIQSPELCLGAIMIMNNFMIELLDVMKKCKKEKLLDMISIVYEAFIILMDSYTEYENKFLDEQLQNVIEKIVFTKHDSDGESLFGQDSTAVSDPLNILTMYGERLVTASGAIYDPTIQALHRMAGYLGGLSIKTVIRKIAQTLASYAKGLVTRIDDLRVACGFPPERSSTSSSLSSAIIAKSVNNPTLVAALKSPLSKHPVTPSTINNSESYRAALNMARALEDCDINGGRALLPSALRALQAAGRLSRLVRSIDTAITDLFSKLSILLFKSSASAIEELDAIRNKTSKNIGNVLTLSLLEKNATAASELRSFISTSIQSSHTVLAPLAIPMSRLKVAAGALLFDLCTATPEKMIEGLSEDEIWAKDSFRELESDGNGPLAAENLLPLPPITQFGEYMLSLVPELESFASSDALADLLGLTGEAQNLTLASRGWRVLKVKLDIIREEDSIGVDQLCKRDSACIATSSAEIAMFGMSLSPPPPPNAEQLALEAASDLRDLAFKYANAKASGIKLSAEEDEAASLAFVNEWLGATSDSAVGLLLVQLVGIRCISPAGLIQLTVDLDYISNVFDAMGLIQHPVLQHIQQLLKQDIQTLPVALERTGLGNGLNPARCNPVAMALHALDKTIIHAICVGHKIQM